VTAFARAIQCADPNAARRAMHVLVAPMSGISPG
jgi:hypothetical protein